MQLEKAILMELQKVLEHKVQEAVTAIFSADLPTVEFQPTRKDFEGDITVVVFPMLRVVKGNPVQIGTQIGEYLVKNVDEVSKFNVVKGFLNLVIADSYYLDFFKSIAGDTSYGYAKAGSKDAVMVEYSSPNTNKPLHLGHIRNNLLGYSVAEILKAAGHKVYKTQIINDRGIHICKSMLAWQKFGEGETPESSGLKGDHLVGKYYVAFDKAYKAEIQELISNGKDKEVAEKEAPILIEAQNMLRKWEAGDDEVVALWKKMNGWVYEGFDTTYTTMGVDFDKLYYESDTYLLGRDVVKEGLEKGVFFKKEDGSVWIDLTDEGLDEKIVLRSDGTAVYMTQDIGTAIQRVTDFPDINGMVYTVGNEQDYHFKVLFLILKKLGYSWAEKLHHLSYGMVDLPSGKMKSREGTVVDADDLMESMTITAAAISEDLGKLEGYSEAEKQQLYKTIGLGALKYYILKVDPKKRILFNPEESVDFQGNTGPFIQYTYARIQSILRKANSDEVSTESIQSEVEGLNLTLDLHEKEKELLKQVQLYPETIQLAAENYSPALIANYTYDLVKEFNSFYQQVSILGEADEAKKNFRVALSRKVGEVTQSSFRLLGVDVPERM
ncbi:arginine--tRNA ligase [Croceitalea sp. MTPC9]|nr:arginine--tRNA ligase [Croceitalea sp. MTPC6]GMN17852.1 arginine--tRNA ligase [Croceitalea sp. MTPC9]